DFKMSENGVAKTYSGSQNYMTDVLKTKAVQFIQDNWDDPFFLYLPLPAPHVDVSVSPFMAIPAPRHAGTCDSIPNWRPPSYNETDWSDKPGLLNYIKPMNSSAADYLDKLRREQICTLKSTDELVAAVIDELGAKLDNTLIIFTSDNGFFWGEHRLNGKNEMYEEAIRVPLAIRYPPMISSPQVRDELVSMVDISATISDI